jgi:hypothetical protein
VIQEEGVRFWLNGNIRIDNVNKTLKSIVGCNHGYRE